MSKTILSWKEKAKVKGKHFPTIQKKAFLLSSNFWFPFHSTPHTEASEATFLPWVRSETWYRQFRVETQQLLTTYTKTHEFLLAPCWKESWQTSGKLGQADRVGKMLRRNMDNQLFFGFLESHFAASSRHTWTLSVCWTRKFLQNASEARKLSFLPPLEWPTCCNFPSVQFRRRRRRRKKNDKSSSALETFFVQS